MNLVILNTKPKFLSEIRKTFILDITGSCDPSGFYHSRYQLVRRILHIQSVSARSLLSRALCCLCAGRPYRLLDNEIETIRFCEVEVFLLRLLSK